MVRYFGALFLLKNQRAAMAIIATIIPDTAALSMVSKK